jgi:hypothetical protein
MVSREQLDSRPIVYTFFFFWERLLSLFALIIRDHTPKR